MSKSLKDLKPGQRTWIDRGIFARRTKAGVVYGISYKAGGSRRTEVAGNRLTDARKALAVRKAEIAQGKFGIQPARKAPSVSTICDRYTEYAKEHKRSWKRDEYVMGKVKGFMGSKRLDEVASFDVERYKSGRRKEVSDASVNRELAILKRMFSLAVDWELVVTNPVKKVRMLPEPEKPFRTLDQKERAALLEACSEVFRPLVVTALNTGMRRSELFNLAWSDVDLRSGALTVTHTKSGRIRHIPLNQTVRATLEALPGPREGFVFRHNGGRWKCIQRQWARSLRIAKEAGTDLTGVRFHDLRHTFATNCVLGGVDLMTVKELLGHSTVRMTERYSHPSPESKRNAVALLESAPQVRHKVVEVEFRSP